MRRFDNDDIPWVRPLPLTEEQYAAGVLRLALNDPDLTFAALIVVDHEKGGA